MLTVPLEADKASSIVRSPGGGGRKLDTSRDAAILSATIDVLVEVGFEKMTLDMVAARARAGKGAMYRRWPSKTEMVLDAVARLKRNMVDLSHLPDTGSLRGDMLALFQVGSAERDERFYRAMAGLAVLLAQQPEIADAGHDALIEPWIEANRILIGRAVARHEVTSGADIAVAAQVIPAMGGYRSLIQRRPFDRPFLVDLLDNVLLPALGIATTHLSADPGTGGR
ncbi:TetR family transcriptional regulator [Rhizobium sp. PP-F2F-G38]|nr:TetR family transcriptional regulator [Rhizobium sp. PP-WC-1G-195]PYE91440.1 TetR family transcriptional regulator [Rhizobium sp. PP-F2F-G38]TCL87975.1 TetR family transcriptional regulator [Rhizobium sp. PP-WC-2G-219]TCP74503.1 TetR family transcriptional regulator [Rhizobium sp. PP-CC-2G-626]TCQ03356.1 TetR family transcriptional regulator [Rhizobium sp. PP-F2F-G36]